MATGKHNLGDYTIEDDSNGDLVIKDPSGTTVLQRDDSAGEWVLDSVKYTSTNRETLSGNKTLDSSSAQRQSLDPGGANRDVTLPAEANGLEFHIANRADAAEDLVVKDDSGTTIATVNQDDVGVFWSDGTGWAGFAAAGGVT